MDNYTFRALDLYGETIDTRTFDGYTTIIDVINTFQHFNEDPKFIVDGETEEVIWSADGKTDVPSFTPREREIHRLLDELAG